MPPGHSWIWWTILTPALGGLVAGMGLPTWRPAAAGSGIPQVKVAYALGRVRHLRETVGKFVLCASRSAPARRWASKGQPFRFAQGSAACWLERRG